MPSSVIGGLEQTKFDHIWSLIITLNQISLRQVVASFWKNNCIFSYCACLEGYSCDSTEFGSPSCPSRLRLLDTPGINVETFHQKHLQDILEMCEKKHGEWDDFTDQVREVDEFDIHILFFVQKNHTNHVWCFPWYWIWYYNFHVVLLVYDWYTLIYQIVNMISHPGLVSWYSIKVNHRWLIAH